MADPATRLSPASSVAWCTDTSKVLRYSEIKNVTIPKCISIDTFKNDRVPDLLDVFHVGVSKA